LSYVTQRRFRLYINIFNLQSHGHMVRSMFR